MSILIKGMKMPSEQYGKMVITLYPNGHVAEYVGDIGRVWEAVPVPPHGRLRRRIVYRGEVYNALESARVNALNGILSDPYKEGFHDGIKRAIQILANEVDDAPTIIEAEEVYGQHTDTAGNMHWVGTRSGEHIFDMGDDDG